MRPGLGVGTLSVTNEAEFTTLGFGQFVDFRGGTLQTAAGLNDTHTFEVPKELIRLKQSELINENPREKAIALDFARRAALATFSTGSEWVSGRMMKMRLGVRIAIP